ncbi:MAG: ABC transporter ATP-binding protein [Candidatus Lokiarchaeota archaeon]|nr:ABC transporter ATP-binding protein [Candidatus Lokiarchaeota archaeon]
MTILKIKNLVKIFGTERTSIKAVNNVSLDLNKGEIILISGPSGSGKTTLLSMIGCLLSPTSGKIIIDNENISQISQKSLWKILLNRIGFIFQQFNLFQALTARENVQIPLQLMRKNNNIKEKSAKLLKELGLENRINHLPKELSGGEKQRVSIARALINNPDIILADEPTANLDSKSGHDVIELTQKMVKKQNCAMIIVTHDNRIEDIADRVFIMEDGKIESN